MVWRERVSRRDVVRRDVRVGSLCMSSGVVESFALPMTRLDKIQEKEELR